MAEGNMNLNIEKETVLEDANRAFSLKNLSMFFSVMPLSAICAGVVYAVLAQASVQVDLSLADIFLPVILCNLSITVFFMCSCEGKPSRRQVLKAMSELIYSYLIGTSFSAYVFVFYSNIPLDAWFSQDGIKKLLGVGLLFYCLEELVVIGLRSSRSNSRMVK